MAPLFCTGVCTLAELSDPPALVEPALNATPLKLPLSPPEPRLNRSCKLPRPTKAGWPRVVDAEEAVVRSDAFCGSGPKWLLYAVNSERVDSTTDR